MARWASRCGWFAVAGVAGGLLAAASCLPDLNTTSCGNGHIDGQETCDPGLNPDPGCTSLCQIFCPTTPSDGNHYFYDSTTNHCYVSPGTPAVPVTFAQAQAACVQFSPYAHLVTYVDEEEVMDVATSFTAVIPSGVGYWVGLSGNGASGPFVSEALHEPGWALSTSCPGCFLHGLTAGSSPPPVDAGAEAGPPSVIVAARRQSNNGVMEVVGPGAKQAVICEREPRGSRSTPCGDGQFCFNTLATIQAGKRYVYHPGALTGAAAEAYCHAFSDAGGAQLVVFDSRAEREQVIYELGQLHLLPLASGAEFPSTGFWIGLAGRSGTGDAGTLDAGVATGLAWVWDDGVRAGPTSTASRPAVWGNRQPPTRTTLPSRAYVEFGSSYDTGLAYARSTDTESLTLPFVCEYR